MKRIEGDEYVSLTFGAVLALLADAKAELRGGSLVGAMECVAQAENALNRALSDLERVTDVPWTALAMPGGAALLQ